MKLIRKFENYMSREEMCQVLCGCGYNMSELEVCSNQELEEMCRNAENIDGNNKNTNQTMTTENLNSREEMCRNLCSKGYSMKDLKDCSNQELEEMCRALNKNENENEEKTNTYESKKWIQSAIKKPGSLKKSMGKKPDEKISKSEIDSELQALRGKDKDKSKPGVQGLSKKDLTKYRRLNLAKTLKGLKEHQETQNYMFFANLQTIKRLADEMLKMDKQELDKILSDGHGWALDHIATSKDDVEEVFNFLASHCEKGCCCEPSHEETEGNLANKDLEDEMKGIQRFNQFKITEDLIPGDAAPDDQIHVFDFDDTLGITKNSNAVMYHVDGKPAHKTKEEALSWMKSLGLTEKDLLSKDGRSTSVDDCIVPVKNKDNSFAIYVSSAGLAKIQKKVDKSKQVALGSNPVPTSGDSILIDFTPSSNTDQETTVPIKSTIAKLSDANKKGSDTVVVTARSAEGNFKDLEGETVTATNAKDMDNFLASKGAKPTLGVYGVSGGNKGEKIRDYFLAPDSDYVKKKGKPEEIHFYDDLSKNTDQVSDKIGGKEDVELFVYGPGEFAHGEADPNVPNKKFDDKEDKKEEPKTESKLISFSDFFKKNK